MTFFLVSITDLLSHNGWLTMRAVSNPPNPFISSHVEYLDEIPNAHVSIYEETAKSIVSENTSPDVPFQYSVNPYRGCTHGCAYCYARASHQYWGFGAGSDFDTKIIVKTNAAHLLKATFDKPSWDGEWISFSGNTDCYQGLESHYRLTRACLAVCAEYRNPVGIITKSPLVCQDIDILLDMHRNASVGVCFSIGFVDDDLARKIEPWAPSPSKRFKAMEVLAKAGISVSVSAAPLIPGLNDSQIPQVLANAKSHGATRAFFALLRMNDATRTVFTERINQSIADKSRKVLSLIDQSREGQNNAGDFHQRMVGKGVYWEAVRSLFYQQCNKLGLNSGELAPHPKTFRRPTKQQSLF